MYIIGPMKEVLIKEVTFHMEVSSSQTTHSHFNICHLILIRTHQLATLIVSYSDMY
jgi:hypothetical protein